MKIYLVGGAVRDELLNLPVKERDYVVVGASAEDMLQLGFRQVGKDFPVFIHPKSGEEYALARTERKVGRGYAGFAFDASPQVTLEEDLLRRDLTINAMAKSDDGDLIDPYHGQADLTNKLLRHVSDAFVEDPVRILRVARFAARYASLGFQVASDTLELMRKMVISKEVDALVAERVWKELERALAEKNPEEFFQVLERCGALAVLFPLLRADGVAALQRVVVLTQDVLIRFAVLLHDLTEDDVRQMCDRYRIPSDYKELALLVQKYLPEYKKAKDYSAEQLVELLMKTDAFRRESRWQRFLVACAVCCGQADVADWLQRCAHAAKKINVSLFAGKLSGQAIAERLRQERVRVLQKLISEAV